MRKINNSKTAEYSHTPRRARKRFASVAIAAVLVIALAGTALAAALSHGDFFESVFGTGIPGRADIEVVTNPPGSTYELPVVQREAVDADKAEALIGGYVVDSSEAIEANGFTLTVQSYAMDKNGIAVLTYTLENPDGLDILHDAGSGCVYYFDEAFSEPWGPRLVEPMFTTTLGEMLLDSRTFIDSSRSTDTKATLVTYITPFGAISDKDGITMTLMGYSEGDNRKLAPPDLAKIIMPAAAKIDTKKFSGKTFSAAVSPVGIMITTTLPDIDGKAYTIIIKYADGSEYIVKSDTPVYILNASVESQHGQSIWAAFNRLVDSDNVESVIISGEELTR
jgi:hypothetical protein